MLIRPTLRRTLPPVVALLFLLGLCTCDPAPSATTDRADPPPVAPAAPVYDFVPGERFGTVDLDGTLDDVRTAYGTALQAATLDGPEGMTYEGYRLFAGTPREVDVTYMPARRLSFLLDERGPAWTALDGRLHVGTALEELVALNGAPLTFSGFGWDYGGFVQDWHGGRLANLGARLAPPPEGDLDASLYGDRSVRSDAPGVTEAEIRVVELVVWGE